MTIKMTDLSVVPVRVLWERGRRTEGPSELREGSGLVHFTRCAVQASHCCLFLRGNTQT